MFNSDKTKFLWESHFIEAYLQIYAKNDYRTVWVLFALYSFRYITFKSNVHKPFLRTPARSVYERVCTREEDQISSNVNCSSCQVLKMKTLNNKNLYI